MIGYKATDKDGKCQGYQYDLPKGGSPGDWHEYPGAVIMCVSGFHFCENRTGPRFYYPERGARLWEMEADGVLDEKRGCGVAKKRACKRIRFLAEIITKGG